MKSSNQSSAAPSELSLIVCTRNRAEALARCLEMIARSDHNTISAELVIVNNGSRDETAAVIDSFAETAPLPVRSVSQPRVGLSNARNAGLAAAKGEILSFTDDDCYVASDFFTSLRDAYHARNFDYSGGRILLYDPTDAFYACNDQDTFERIAPHSFIPAGKVQGANMAITRRLYESVGPFDPDLGAGTSFRCEDVDYVARASSVGFAGAHLPQVVVEHHHGRKEGPELEQLKRENDYARGAYYAKHVLGGELAVLYHWPRITWGQRPNHRLRSELWGAFGYLVNRLRR
jgi:glycosyltransferase involved in cell wall biosynthesis